MINESILKLLTDFADQSDLLFEKGIIRTDSFIGEIGEYFACNHFNLKRTPKSCKGIDAVGPNEEKFQIKAKTIKTNAGYSLNMNGVDPNLDYLCVVYLDEFLIPIKLLKISKAFLPSKNVAISEKFLSSIEYEEIGSSQLQIPNEIRQEIRKFGAIFNNITNRSIY